MPLYMSSFLIWLAIVVNVNHGRVVLSPNADTLAIAQRSAALADQRAEELKWELVPQTPKIEPIFGQSCNMYSASDEPRILMYAGFLNNTQNTNDMRSFSIKSHSWSYIEQHSTSSIPWERNAAATVLYSAGTQKELLMFGGAQMDAESLGDTWIFDLVRRIWTEYTAGVGKGPSRRYGSSLVLREGTSTAVLFGGAYWRERIYHNDLWSFSFLTRTWTALNSTGDSPSPRFGHCAAYFYNHMYVYGGGNDAYSSFQIVWVYSFDNKRWSQVMQIPPAGRAWAQSVVFDDYWYVIGGDRNGTDYIDVLRWPLDPVSARGPWEKLSIAKPLPAGRLDHCVVLDDKQIYMIGGYSFEQSGAVDDMWMLNLTDENRMRIFN